MLNFSIRREFLLGTVVLISGFLSLKAQTPNDGVMMKTGQICLAAIYNYESWDKYWEGLNTKVNGNIGTFTSQSYAGMFNLGITDRLNLIGGIPYVKNEPSAGQVIGQKGIQNLSLFLKYQFLEKSIASGKLDIFSTLGFTTPLGSYIPDAAFSLGLGCTEISLRPIVQYKHKTGIFLRLNAAYTLRGQATLGRDYYFTTTGYYSKKVEVPDAFDYEASLGYLGLNDHLKVELNYFGFDSQGGFDIRKHDGGFPSNEMDFTKIGGSIKYWIPKVHGLGIEVFGRNTLTGRNVGQSSSIGFAINYFFNAWHPMNKTETK